MEKPLEEKPWPKSAEETEAPPVDIEFPPHVPEVEPREVIPTKSASWRTTSGKESAERITERALFAACEGYRDRQRESEKVDGEPATKEAKEREAAAAREVYSELLARWVRQELGEKMPPEVEAVILAEKYALLERKYEAKTLAPEDESRLKKAWKWYGRQPVAVRTALTAALATGAIYGGGAYLGFAVAGLTGGLAISGARRWLGGMVSASITAAVASNVDKIPAVKRWLESRHAKDYERIQQETREERESLTLENFKTVISELSQQNEDAEARAGKREERVRFWSGLSAGVLTGLLVGGIGRAIDQGLAPEVPAMKAPELLPIAEPAPDPTVIIEKGGNIWKASRMLDHRFHLSEKDFYRAWGRSTVLIDGERVPIHKVNLVHPGTTVSWDADDGVFRVDGSHMGLKVETPAHIAPPEPSPTLEELGEGRPQHAPVESLAEPPTRQNFAEQKLGGQAAPEHIPESDPQTTRFLHGAIKDFFPNSHYDKIKNVKLHDLFAKREGCRWGFNVWNPLNQETYGSFFVSGEQLLNDRIQESLKGLGYNPLQFGDKTIDEALRFITQKKLRP